MKRVCIFFLLNFIAVSALVIFLRQVGASAYEASAPASLYTGSVNCQPCHQEIYERFSKYSKKAGTRTQVEKLLPKLTSEEQKACFQCHATGYGQPGGFVSYAQTPELGDIGCEACHGPGAIHIQSGNAGEAINRRPDQKNCVSCHTQERGGVPVTAKMFSGAH
jgi:hypothetical protein